MAELTLESKFDIIYNSVLSAQEFKNRYLAGIPLPDTISDDILNFFISSATSEIETYLGLKLNKQVIIEDKDFRDTDWKSWGYMPTTYPCVKPLELAGFLGTTKQITYPADWLSARDTNDNKSYSRRVSVVPTRNSAHSEAIIFSGIIPQAHYFLSSSIPNYWTIKYITGWDTPPADILDAIGMLTAIKVLQLISDALMSGDVRQVVNNQGQSVLMTNGTQFGGLGFGMSSKSVSIDGLSQSYSSYVNGQTGVWGARLKGYLDTMNAKQPGSLLNRLCDQYQGLVFVVA